MRSPLKRNNERERDISAGTFIKRKLLLLLLNLFSATYYRTYPPSFFMRSPARRRKKQAAFSCCGNNNNEVTSGGEADFSTFFTTLSPYTEGECVCGKRPSFMKTRDDGVGGALHQPPHNNATIFAPKINKNPLFLYKASLPPFQRGVRLKEGTDKKLRARHRTPNGRAYHCSVTVILKDEIAEEQKQAPHCYCFRS